LPPVAGPQVTHAGDLWLLGRHRVYRGDALDDAAYDALMSGDTAAIVFTDPAYNVKIDVYVSGSDAVQHREFAMASAEMTAAEFTKFLTRACAILNRYSDEGSIHFGCIDWRHFGSAGTCRAVLAQVS
jgi:DNA modification methylase